MQGNLITLVLRVENPLKIIVRSMKSASAKAYSNPKQNTSHYWMNESAESHSESNQNINGYTKLQLGKMRVR